jgi:hypothetical protein
MPRLRRASRLALPAAVLALLAACGGGVTDSKPPELTRLTIDLAALDTLSELATRQLGVAGTDDRGRTAAVGTVTWESSDTTIATVSDRGLVTARRPGNTSLTVRSGAISASLPLRVVTIPVRDVTVRLAGAISGDTMLVGTAATLVGEPRDIAGRLLLGRLVTYKVDPAAGGTLDSLGRLVGRVVGPLEFVVRVDSIERRRIVIVRPPLATALAVRLADRKKLGDTMWVGLQDSAIVSFADSTGKPLPPDPLRPASFTTDKPGVLGIDSDGRITPLAAGTATIRALGDRLVAAKLVTVVPAPVTTILAAPDTVRILPGDATALRPVLVDGAGLRVATLGARVLRYESDDPGVATVDAQGTVRGVATGIASIRMTLERGTGLVEVHVVAPAGARAFQVNFRFAGPPPAPEVAEAFALAKARWERVIRERLGTNAVTIPRGACGSPDSTHTEQITDVLILARIDSIDGPGNVLGQAGPCAFRRLASGRYMPVVGAMQFDSADMRTMASNGRLQNVIAHEMGHVLGIGTLWDDVFNNGTALAVQGGSDPRYSGRFGVRAAAGMGFTGLTVDPLGAVVLDRVPLENIGGPGTAGSHWRRSVFGNELMNGFAGSGLQPLSLLTVQAMADMGYVVNTSAAEPWGQFLTASATPALSRIFGAGDAIPIGERILEPLGVVDDDGRIRPLRRTAPRK